MDASLTYMAKTDHETSNRSKQTNINAVNCVRENKLCFAFYTSDQANSYTLMNDDKATRVHYGTI